MWRTALQKKWIGEDVDDARHSTVHYAVIMSWGGVWYARAESSIRTGGLTVGYLRYIFQRW